MTRWLARRAGVEPEEVAWRVVEGPRFENHLGELELDGRRATLRVEQAVTPGRRRRSLPRALYGHQLADGS